MECTCTKCDKINFFSATIVLHILYFLVDVSSCYHVCVRGKYKVIPELDVVCENETLAHTITTQGVRLKIKLCYACELVAFL